MSHRLFTVGFLFFVSILILVSFGFILASAQEDEGFDQFAGIWDTDFSRASVTADEILFGGPPPDGIPPYYPEGYIYPQNAPRNGGQPPRFYVEYTDFANTDSYLPDEQQVIVVEINGDVRAYPLLLLNNHEIVNTEIGGVPVAVTFCPLCNASIVYERQVNDQVLHFGVSGLLRNSDLIMWDHETQSWWQQFTGEAIVGELTGTQLVNVPSVVVSWGDFKAEHPNGKVLANQTGSRVDLVSYAGYDAEGNAFLFRGEVDDRLFTTERVLGYFGAEGAIAYPFEQLAAAGVVNDRIGGDPVVIFWQPGAVSLFTNTMETGSAAMYSATLADDLELTFISEGNVIKDEQTGSTWNVFGRATAGELTDTQLELILSYPHFWFAWAAFRPDTLVWEPGLIADAAWQNP